jgi:type IV secretion system protein TrbL
LIFMMCCWQIPKLFAAVIGGSPALTGGDLIATTAVVGGAALAAGRVAVAGVTALAGVGAGAAAGAGSAGGAGGTGSRTTTAVASVGTVGANSSAGDSVSPPSSPSSGFAGVSERRQPDPPSSGLRPSISSALSSIGGESLEGSGFETERPQRGFARMSVTAGEQTSAAGRSASPLAVRGGASGDGEGAALSNLTSPDSSGIVPDVASVGSAGSMSPQAPPPANRKNPLTRAVDQVRSLRRRLRSLPSDAAPHATPPRIPIDHEE